MADISLEQSIKFSKPIIIGITGKKGTGKSTISEYLIDNYNFAEFAFANTLKYVCMEMYKLTSQQLFGKQSDKERIDDFWGTSPRVIMQETGYAIREMSKRVPELDKIWIRNVHREIELKGLKQVVISDVRYNDEADSIREYSKKGWDVLIIKVIRDAQDAKSDNHESEMQEIPFDLLINNNSTRKSLFNDINSILACVNK